MFQISASVSQVERERGFKLKKSFKLESKRSNSKTEDN